MQVHPVFHVSLLEPAAQDPLPGEQQPLPPPVEIDGEQEWFVDSILDSRMYRRRLQLSDVWVKGQPRPAEAAALSCVRKSSGGGGGNSPLVTRQAATGDI